MTESPATVLLVDDDNVLTMSLGAVLERAGYRTLTSPSAEDPRFAAGLSECSALVLDVEIPGGASGFDIVERLRAQPAFRDLPILMLTAHNPIAYRLKGLRLGADDYLAKPVDPQELLLRIGALLRRTSGNQSQAWRLTARRGDRSTVVLDVRDITHIEAQRGFCFAHAGSQRYIVNRTLSEIEGDLPIEFMRVHRSYLVNPSHITGLQPRSAWLSELVLDDKTQSRIPVSKSLLPAVRERLAR